MALDSGTERMSLTVTSKEFQDNPSSVIDTARDEGPVTITDEEGNPRMMIVIPKGVGSDDELPPEAEEGLKDIREGRTYPLDEALYGPDDAESNASIEALNVKPCVKCGK